MLDAQDVQKLVEVLASKTDIASLDDRMSVVEQKQDKVIEILDKMVYRMEGAQSRIFNTQGA
jgi:energy-converting hydrogenase A subunit M